MACPSRAAAPTTAPTLTVSPQGLLAAFAAVPDPRRQASIDLPPARASRAGGRGDPRQPALPLALDQPPTRA